MRHILFLAFIGLLGLSSCGVNSNLMFKTPKGSNKVIRDSIPLEANITYKMSVDDKFYFNLYTNDGRKVLDIITGSIANTDQSQQIAAGNQIIYVIDKNGTVELPVVGRKKVAGLTINAFEDSITSYYQNRYSNPFVQVEVTNKRVIVFPGNGSDAKVVPLENNNTTLMEAIALAGGITDRGKSSNIKVMRLEEAGRVVYEIDLSTIDGLMYADMIVQANDYIYVEPSAQLSKEIVSELAPIVTVISSAAILITLITNLK